MYLPPISTVLDINLMSTVDDAFPLSLSPNNTAIQQMLQDIFLTTHLSIHQTEDLSSHLHRMLRIRLSNGYQLILKLSPSTTTPVLQHERHSLDSEAAVYSLLSKANLPIPRILRYEKRNNHLGSPFMVTTTLAGTSCASALPHLNRSQREDISQQLQTIRTQINSYTSPNGTFGPAVMVAAGTGLRNWREAFKLMINTILIDGENMTVNLPYAEIRETVNEYSQSFEEIREARLVILGLGRPENVLIQRKTCDVTGLLDFGQALWGDVGFDSAEGCGGVRGLLYTIYHALVTIVTNHYRPQEDMGKELDARKTLTMTLAQLAAYGERL